VRDTGNRVGDRADGALHRFPRLGGSFRAAGDDVLAKAANLLRRRRIPAQRDGSGACCGDQRFSKNFAAEMGIQPRPDTAEIANFFRHLHAGNSLRHTPLGAGLFLGSLGHANSPRNTA